MEWISDNFRYILLVIAAIVVILIIIFAVRAVANKNAGKDQGELSVKPLTVEEEEAANRAGNVPAVVPSEKLVKADADVQNLVSSYLIAMAAGDVAKVESVSESVSDELRAYIQNGHSAMGYTDIKVFQYPGTNEDEYVAVSVFNYTERATGNVLPGISAFYILKGEDGSLKIASGTTLERNRSTVNEVLGIPEVEQLVIDTNAAVEAATKAAEAAKTESSDAGAA